ncbi:GNAT family N-acetyltransferase [Pseudomonas mangiferae]|uniref:GNAT family N-acetyltransferase n=1 Tax=Pseudomonas mangiferae TaxID=2593654 RepID=A0A553GXL1_9PSED|nr:GNAT family N-acetyltransferase [Pseudomonas mangiferae]TRX74237.1 GNAT family N-acetyltransferase [Pseudomonas mangiferae]
MTEPIELETPRLRLRTWRRSDLPAYVEMSADPEVMRYFPAPQDAARTEASYERIQDHFARHGFGLWAMERKDNGAFIGMTGLGYMGFEAHFSPAVEIGWRLARAHWGQGFAREAARAALACGFERLGLEQVVAYTAVENQPSRRVMEAIGMHRDPADDFDHPDLPPGHWLRRHVLYRLWQTEWPLQNGAPATPR